MKPVTARRPERMSQRRLAPNLVSGVTRAVSVTASVTPRVERALTSQLSPATEVPRGTSTARDNNEKPLDLTDRLANWEATNDKEREAIKDGK